MHDVTVIMSVYNGQAFVKDAIESILHQTWQNFEFLILNDGSTDNSRDIIQSFKDSRIRLIDNHARMGLARSLNLGLQLSKGDLIARQDADDISYQTRLEQEVKFLNRHIEIALLGSCARAINKKGNPTGKNFRVPAELQAIRWFLMFQNPFIHSSVMFRRNVIWEKLGGYDPTFERAQDYELWSRVARNYKVANLADILLDHRYEYGSIVSQLPFPASPEESVVHKNLQAFLRNPEIPAEWARIITRFRRKYRFGKRTDWQYILKMFETIYDRFFKINPKAAVNETISKHMAGSLYWISYYSASHHRGVSLRSFAAARKLSAKSRSHPPLAKYAALWFAGERLRRAYKWFGLSS